MLATLVSKGKGSVSRIKHTNILLAIDANDSNRSDRQAAEAYRCHDNTVRNVRQRCVEEGLDAALERKTQTRPSRQRLLDGEQVARLTRIACSQPPKGRAKWTLKLLAEELVALEVVDSISDQTVRRTLKKTNFDPTCTNVG
jgi:transposase